MHWRWRRRWQQQPLPPSRMILSSAGDDPLFVFSVNKGVDLAAGNYIVTHDQTKWTVRNADTRQAVEIVNSVGLEGKTAEQPALTFDCLATHCQLRAIRMGGGTLGAEVPAPKQSNSDKAALGFVTVGLKPVK